MISGPRSNGSREVPSASGSGCSEGASTSRGNDRSGEQARGHRLAATHDDRRLENLDEWRSGALVDRGSTGEDARRNQRGPSTPTKVAGAKTVRPSGPATASGCAGGPQSLLVLLGRAALPLDGGGDLRPDLVPEPAGARRGERLHLQCRLAEHGGRRVDLLGALVDLEAQLHPGHAAHPQRAEVDAAVAALDLGDVPGSVGARAAGGLGSLGCVGWPVTAGHGGPAPRSPWIS